MSEITSLAEIVRVHGRDRAAHTAIIQGERTLTWAELYERACRVAQALADVGVGSQDRVAFLDKNGIEHFEVFFGASLLNAVCVDVNWRLAAPEVEYIVNDSEAKVFVVGPDFVPLLDTIAANLSSVDTIVVIGGHDRYESFADWVGRYPALDPGATSELDDVAFQLYSSGTTGRPKGVMLSNNNFFGLLPVAKEIWELTPDAVNLVAMPLFHIGGGGWATAGMYEGCTSVIVRELDPAALVGMFGRARDHPRVPGAGRAPVHADGARCRGRRLLEPADHRVRRVADQRRRAGAEHRGLQVQVLAGVRDDRVDRHGRQPAARGSRSERRRTRTACVRAAWPDRVSNCASSMSTPRRTPRSMSRPVRSARSGFAHDR